MKKIDTQHQDLNHHLLSGAIEPDAYSEMRDGLNSRKAEVTAKIAELEAAEVNFVDFACANLKLVSDFNIKYLHRNPTIRM